MRKIINPFSHASLDEYGCFGCSPKNSAGLQLQFWDLGDSIMAKWLPEKKFEGFSGILHGGIQATLIDEAASWLVFTKCGTAGVTTDMKIRYMKSLPVNTGELTITAKISGRNKRMATIGCKITDKDGIEYSKGELRYFLFPEETAKEKFTYPGVEAFYEG